MVVMSRRSRREDREMYNRRAAVFSILYLLSSILLFPLCGCNVVGAAANALPPPIITPQYKGLAGQSVGVLVWADRGIHIDWPSLPLDTAGAIQNQLQAKQKDKLKELRDTQFPVKPASIIRYMRDHPELENTDITQVAPRFGVSRLIYVEVNDFSTRAAASLELFRGSMGGSMKVIEIQNGQAKVVYEENNL